ncbi:MAG: right-handed parallel beta-helix repeat-containing protein [Methanomicrobiaceae archaeon]|uniref:Cell surface protein n=1 Tax=hydrocarbon metagenome TaxID=938273 RepID=A0A0W8FJL0_9ZZZZ|nr:right-handed parallel beta-helix repeat-containing protein [Methanomicrobiaceae archaeon]
MNRKYGILIGIVLLSLVACQVAVAADKYEFITTWDSIAHSDEEFNYPYGIAIDAAGKTLYLVDKNNCVIHKFSLSDDISRIPEIQSRNLNNEIPSLPTREWTVGPDYDDEFGKIQDAIDAANDGDTIIVKSGRYQENVVVNKQLILRGNWAVIVDSVTLSADGIDLSGFTVVHGIWVLSNNNYIENVYAGWDAEDTGWGVDGFSISGSNNVITNCLVYGYYLGGRAIGLTLASSNGNTISEIYIIDGFIGIDLNGSNNIFQDSSMWTRGCPIILDGSNYNTFTNCFIECNTYIDHGISLFNSNENTFINCDIFGGGHGVYICGSNENSFTNCRIEGCLYGVCQESNSKNNIFTCCTVYGGIADWYGFPVPEFPTVAIPAVMVMGFASIMMVARGRR